MEKTTFGAGVQPASISTLEDAFQYVNEFQTWFATLPLVDAQQVVEILQQVRGAHVPGA